MEIPLQSIHLHISLPAIILFFVAIINIASANITRRNNSPSGAFFLMLILAITVWDIAYIGELGSDLPSIQLFCARVEYVGIVSIPILWIQFIRYYSQELKRLTGRWIGGLSVIPVVTLFLVWTSDWHNLFWTSVRTVATPYGNQLSFEYGIAFWVFFLYFYLLVLSGSFHLVSFFFRTHRVNRLQDFLLVIIAPVPFIVDIFHLLNFNLIQYIDITPYLFSIAGIFLSIGIHNFRMFDLAPVAREMVIERMPEGLVVINTDNQVVDINPAACAIFRMKANDAMGKPVNDLLIDAGFDPASVDMNRDIHTEISLDDERWIDLEISLLFDKHKKNNGKLILLRDISYIKEKEKTIRLSEKRYMELYSSARRQTREILLLDRVRNAISSEMDVRTISHIVTEGITKDFGYPQVSIYLLENEVLKLQDQVGYTQIREQIPVLQGFESEIVCHGLPILARIADTKNYGTRVKDNGSSRIGIPLFNQQTVAGVIIVESSGKMPLTIDDQHLLEAVGEQVSIAISRASIFAESKKIQEALDKERRLLRTVIDNIPDQIFARDRECRFTLNNLADAQKMGVSDPEQLLGKNDMDFYRPDLARLYVADDKRVLESGQPLINIIEPSIDDWGNERWTMTTKVPLRDSQDEIIGLVGIARDITEERRTAKALEEAKFQAEEANSAKSKFLANISHEIRTPLNAILGFSQLLLREPDLSSQHRHQLATIHHSGEHLLELINDVLEISKIEAGRATLHINTFDLYSMVHDLKTMFQIRMDEKHLAFDVTINKGVPEHVVSDENKLRQILINLIGNAVKFTKQGQIGCTVRAAHIEENDWRLTIDVEDSGIGIAEENIPLLFHVFQQIPGNTSEGGTGLGLAISQRFAKMLNGQITVTSKPGQGSCFTLEVIVQEDLNFQPVEKPNQLRIKGIKDQATPYRVLVVDDNRESRELLSSLLAPVGFEIRETANGREALAAWKRWSPHLIIMDIRMPVMDGLEATRQVRKMERRVHIPIIAATASAFEEERQKILDTGMTGYLRKPIQDQELFRQVGECLGITYEYYPDEVITEKPAQPGKASASLADELKTIAADKRESIVSACTSADVDSLLKVIEQLTPDFPHAANQLQELAQKLKYEEISKILQGEA